MCSLVVYLVVRCYSDGVDLIVCFDLEWKCGIYMIYV